jgi:hypothetical protein
MSKKVSKKPVQKPKKEKKDLDELSKDNLKDLVLIANYKLALTKAQVEALSQILIKNRLMTYEEFWKLTNEILKESK